MTAAPTASPDLILHGGRFTTLDRANPNADAAAVKDGVFTAVGSAREIIPTAGPQTRIIDLGGRRVVPGLIDSHTHVIRGGLNYNMELRWDGVPSLADAMAMLKTQAANTPPPQWVRVVGGFTRHQFAEKRLPTLDEINAAAPETPVFILHLYDRALLNRAALRAVGYTKDTPNPPGGEIQRDAAGEPTGMLIAQPNAMILYSTLAKGPKLPEEYQLNSTRHFMRELNRLGVTSVIDAGGGFQNYPDDYEIIEKLHEDGQLTVRLAYNLFTQKPKEELNDFKTWGKQVRPGQGDDYYRHNGAGEMLVYSAADFEDFRQPRPDMPANMETDLEPVIRQLVEQRWPWRLHATYNETIDRALDVYEKVNRDMPFDGLHWFFDHAETISDQSIDRIAALEAQAAARTETSRANARAFATPESWSLRMRQVSFTQWGLGIAALAVAILTAVQMIVTRSGVPDPSLMVLLTAIVMGLVNTFRDQTGFSFGGTADSNATAIARDELAARRQS